MAVRMKLTTEGFESLINRLRHLDADVRYEVGNALEELGKEVASETHTGMSKSNLPAGGKYSEGDTEKSIEDNPKPEWWGNLAIMGVGFDFNKRGAGGYLITGTPRMKPDKYLQKIYKGRKFSNDLKVKMTNALYDAIRRNGG